MKAREGVRVVVYEDNNDRVEKYIHPSSLKTTRLSSFSGGSSNIEMSLITIITVDQRDCEIKEIDISK